MAVHDVFRKTRPAVILLLQLCLAPVLAAQNSQAVTRVINGHLDDALGPLEFRSVERRVVVGAGRVETRQAGKGALAGTFTLDTSPVTNRLRVEFGATNYDGETFEFDGTKTTIGFSQPQLSRRSALGMFIADYDVILREGLLGGVLNAGWSLLDLSRRQAKIETDGMKNFDGRGHYKMRYRAKSRQGDLDIALYFDPKTYRHTATVYSWSRAQNLGATIVSSSQESDLFLQLEERFGDFEPFGKLTLPTTWSMAYTETGNRSTFWRYTFKVSEIRRP